MPEYVKKLPSGRWRAEIQLGRDPVTGKRRSMGATFDSPEEARNWKRATTVKKDEGTIGPMLSKATLADYLRGTWLPFYAKKARSVTVYNAEKVLGKWILNTTPELGVPLLGRIPLRRLTARNFTALYIAMSSAPHNLKRRGIEHVHSLLHRALEHAVPDELPSNPVSRASIPTPEANAEVNTQEDEDESEMKYLAPEQVNRFRAAAMQQVDPDKPDTYRWPALWLLLLDAGLRPSEALALKWRHIDPDRQIVTVAASLSRLRNEERKERGQSWVVRKPKTKKSKDSVPVCASTMEALSKWRAKQKELRMLVGDLWVDNDFVFTTEVGAPLGNNLRRAWMDVMREADGGRGDLGTWTERERKVVTRKTKTGRSSAKCSLGPKPLPTFTPTFSPYVLRHTCGTMLAQNGLTIQEVAARLRNGVGTCQKYYVHMKASDNLRAVEVWDRLFAKPMLKLA
jgi:integrase